MKIYKFSRILSGPFVIGLLVMAYLVYKNPLSNLLGWALVPLIGLALIYMFQPQIDYWWMSRNPVELDLPIKNMLTSTNPRYQQMKAGEREEFEKRLVLFSEGREFFGKTMEADNSSVPIDIKNMICQIPVMMTLGRDKVGFKNWERVVLYKHPFGTPINKFLHTMETHGEDGVVILSLEHVDKALLQKGHHYDVAWHAYSEAFIKDHPKEAYPDLPGDVWKSIERISPQNQQVILGTLGFPSIDPMPVLINLYFNYPDAFAKELPQIKTSFDGIFFPKGGSSYKA